MNPESIHATRRSFVGGLAAAGGLALSSPLTLGSALAKAPLTGTQAPYFYRFKLGGVEGTVVSDGTLPLGDPNANFVGLSKDEMTRQLTDSFLPVDNAVLEQNALIVNTGDRLVLFDTGMGPLQTFGPTTGKLLKSMSQAGIDPKDIDAVVMTHGHIDHVSGCMTADDKRNFPNAQYYIAQADYDFWTNEKNVPKEFKVFIDTATKNLVPNRDRMVFFKDGQEFLPGIQAVSAPGHTVGHTMFMITSGGKSLSFIGDLTHHPVLLMEKPLTEFLYDTDAKQSAQTRVKMLTMLAANKIPILAYHFAWPGIGNVAKQGDGFRYYPQGMKMEL